MENRQGRDLSPDVASAMPMTYSGSGMPKAPPVAMIVVGMLLGLGLVGYCPGIARAGDPYDGKKQYAQHCVRCHGPQGRGVMPGVPDFSWRGTNNNALMTSNQALLSRIRSGGKGCPSFQGMLSSQDILNVLTHLRTLR